MEFKEGMKVRILPRKPEWEEEGPEYINRMGVYEGDVVTLPTLRKYDNKQAFDYGGYTWLVEWVTPAVMENV